ncbi:hypothetical protein F8388_013133 [Cannabis sativa]|uniref:Uncharacterized protein n=1 Tax=Cannabis sativa TaxID=3483 RepID=A0A7J6HL48_CANSA|nr:hypothetical protein F8388_013133 [Cannabis sativa]
MSDKIVSIIDRMHRYPFGLRSNDEASKKELEKLQKEKSKLKEDEEKHSEEVKLLKEQGGSFAFLMSEQNQCGCWSSSFGKLIRPNRRANTSGLFFLFYKAGEDLHNMIALDFLELGSHSYNNRGFPSLTSMTVDGGQNVAVVDDKATTDSYAHQDVDGVWVDKMSNQEDSFDQEDSFEQALNHDPKSKKPKKKTRNYPRKIYIENEIQRNSTKGALARNGWVPIDLPNWHNADEVKLDMIWKEMKTTFDLDDCVRHQTLSNIGNKWRGFKSRLTNNFIMKYMEDPAYRAKNPHTLMFPPAIYPGITQPVWHNFVATRTTPEFQELRRLQQARRAANENPHRLGRKGYPNLEYELQQQLDTEEEIERAVLWKEARKDKKGEYAKESDKEIADTIDSLFEKRKQGEVVEIDCFPKSKGGVRSLHERQIIYENETRRKYETEIESLKKGTNDIEKIFKAVMKALEEKSHGHQGLSTDIEAHFSPNIVQEMEDEDIANDHVEEENVEHSVEDKNDYPNLLQDESNYPNLVQNESFIDVIVTPNQGTCSRLDLENLIDKQATRYVLLDSIHRKVAKGIIRQAAEVHNKSLEENDYRIEVNELLIPDALIPNAIDPDEIYLVKHVFISYVAWPKHLVLLEGEKIKKYTPKRKRTNTKQPQPILPKTQSQQQQETSLASSSSSARPPQNSQKVTFIDDVPSNLKAMWNDIMKKSESFMISVPVNEHMFGIKEHSIAVIKEDVQFMPQLLAAILGRTPDDRARDLAKRLGEIIPRQLLMAAFNDG